MGLARGLMMTCCLASSGLVVMSCVSTMCALALEVDVVVVTTCETSSAEWLVCKVKVTCGLGSFVMLTLLGFLHAGLMYVALVVDEEEVELVGIMFATYPLFRFWFESGFQMRCGNGGSIYSIKWVLIF